MNSCLRLMTGGHRHFLPKEAQALIIKNLFEAK
jgi:hypothetical protein